MAEDKSNVPFDAPWADNLKHRPDPNRVSDPHTPEPGRQEIDRRPSYVPPDPATAHPARTAPQGEAAKVDPQPPPHDPKYYDVPMLTPPVWEWMIAVYFYLGGLSAGSYVVSRMAERFGGAAFKDVARVGSKVAWLSLLPCPPLLIADLGDPKRFHHMLRVWKPSSPMNFGTWVLTSYSGPATLEAARHYLAVQSEDVPPEERGALDKLLNSGTLVAISDAAGVPLALLLASYTGVLLSTTSNPLWCKNSWLAPMFVASAVSTGAEAISLALDLAAPSKANERAQAVLCNIDTLAHAGEAVAMTGFLKQAGEKAAPLTRGGQRKAHHLTIGSIAAAEVLKRLPLPRRLDKPRRMLANVLGLTGGLAMRWALSYGGHESAQDPRAGRINSGTK